MVQGEDTQLATDRYFNNLVCLIFLEVCWKILQKQQATVQMVNFAQPQKKRKTQHIKENACYGVCEF